MSVRFLQSNTPQENQTIKCNDITVRGSVVANESVSVANGISLNGELSFQANTDATRTGKIQFPVLVSYTQATSNTTAITVSGAEQQFKISTFESSPGVGGDIASGAGATFSVSHAGIVAGKTIILVSKQGSYNDNTNVNVFVGDAGNGVFQLTRRNFGSTTASGTEEILVKLIHTA